MNLPYSWGQPTATPGVYALGGKGWEITWSPDQIHPQAAQWLSWAARFGPPTALAPREDLWVFALQTKATAVLIK